MSNYGPLDDLSDEEIEDMIDPGDWREESR